MISYDEFRYWCLNAYPKLFFRFATESGRIVAAGISHDPKDTKLYMRIQEYGETEYRAKGPRHLLTDQELYDYCVEAWGDPLIPWPTEISDSDERVRLISYLTGKNYTKTLLNSGKYLITIKGVNIDITLSPSISSVQQIIFKRSDMQGFEGYLRKLLKSYRDENKN